MFDGDVAGGIQHAWVDDAKGAAAKNLRNASFRVDGEAVGVEIGWRAGGASEGADD